MKEDIKSLLRRYARGECTSEEIRKIESFILKNNAGNYTPYAENELLPVEKKMRLMILGEIKKNKPSKGKSRKLWYVGIAASIILSLIVFGHLYDTSTADEKQEKLYISEATTPGNATAILKLVDGTTLALDDYEGQLLNDNKLLAENVKGKQLTYNADVASSDEKLAWNELIIPRGGHYKVILSDGTQVTLNSASTLKYPSNFSRKDRTVYLTGEAYFDVAKDEHRPFSVHSNKQQIQVTGTQFNVRAYANDNSFETSLLEGGVTLSLAGQSVGLMPGQQALTSLSAEAIKVRKFEKSHVMAWLYGDLVFDNKSLESIMEEVERWYNVDVQYIRPISTKSYGGSFTKANGLPELLAHLTKITGYQFIVQGRRIIVKS